MAMLASLGGGGGGVSASSSASTGPSKSGDIGGASFVFEGINTGTRSSVPGWVWPAAIVVVAIVGFIAFRSR